MNASLLAAKVEEYLNLQKPTQRSYETSALYADEKASFYKTNHPPALVDKPKKYAIRFETSTSNAGPS